MFFKEEDGDRTPCIATRSLFSAQPHANDRFKRNGCALEKYLPLELTCGAFAEQHADETGTHNETANWKGAPMTQESESGNGVQNKVWWHVSVDGWAVALALVLALLVWIGAIKHIPW
jgi:hypothetical protein